jgi:hypothetical protein
MTPLTSNLPVVQQEVQGSNIKPSQHLKQRLYSSEQRITEEDKIVIPVPLPLLWYGREFELHQ